MEHYDLVVIGTGSGNSIIGPEHDSWKVAIVEEWVFGGTCLNRGCIPTKMLVHAADLAESVRHASALGVDATLDGVRWRDIRDRVFDRIDPISAGGADYRTNRCPNITVYTGTGRFISKRTIAVTMSDGGEQLVSADRVVVAVGARPHVPEVDGLSPAASVPVVAHHTSDSIMRIDSIPERLIVVGGGFIANEMAHVFGSFGSQVSLVARGDRLLTIADMDISHAFTREVRARSNFDVHLGARMQRVEGNGIDGSGVRLRLAGGIVIQGDALLVATGRTPNSDRVHAAAGGLAMHADGRIIVDDTQATNVEGVWALGDVSSPHQLKHVANHEARVVRHNLMNPQDPLRTDHRFVPSAVFTRPQLAGVGLTEAQARERGHDVITKIQNYGDVAYGWAMEDRTSFVKLIADAKSRLLLGAHLMGPQASVLIQQLIQGMHAGQTVDEMARSQYYIHPSLSEVVENALLGL